MRFNSLCVQAFILSSCISTGVAYTLPCSYRLKQNNPDSSSFLLTRPIALFAKKKKGGKQVLSLETLDALLDEEGDEGLSLKEKAANEKKMKKEAKRKEKEQQKVSLEALLEDEGDEGLSLKERASKEKKMKKEAKRKEKEQQNVIEEEEEKVIKDEKIVKKNTEKAEVLSSEEKPLSQPSKLTLEDKIRKERPPPSVRVMEINQPNFVSLRLDDVYITFRDQEVLKGVTWGVSTNELVGLVGPNGAGKSTQIRILAGEAEPTAGDIVKSKSDLRVAILRQEFIEELDSERTLLKEFESVFQEENQILSDIRNAETELESCTSVEDSDKMQEILDRLQDLQNKAENKGVYAMESRIRKVMDVMGFTSDQDATTLVGSYSGGWKMRIGLGKVLLQEPNILLLDEPTNHLDLESVEWIEEFLKNQKTIPMVVVSHDREFLDRVCNKIVDTDGGIAAEYDGNYSNFLKLKKARMEAWQAAYDAQEKKIKEDRKWIQKFKIKQAQAVKQRQAKIEKLMKSDKYVQKPPSLGKPFHFRFPDAPRLSPEVVEVKDLCHSYGDKQLFNDAELLIEKGDRIAIVGPNGCGKSTLLRLIVGTEEPSQSGCARITGQNVVANYFEQNQADALDLDKTVIETVQGASSQQSYNELRALLGKFLFKGDSVEKKVRNLSGGEKARLSLCCMMLTPANLLILDEPTNHLDIPAKEMLEEALQYFHGSVIIVSHDRYFISKVANTIVAVEDHKLTKYSGDYKFYLEKSAEIREKVEGRYVAGVEKIRSAPIIDAEKLLAANQSKNFGGAKKANLVSRKDKGVKNAKRHDT